MKKTEMYEATEVNINAYRVVTVWTKQPSWFARKFLKHKPESFREESIYIMHHYFWYTFPALKKLNIFSEPISSSYLDQLRDEMILRNKIYKNELPEL